MKKMKSEVHATMMAHLWFLRDLIKEPANVLCGEYIMRRKVANVKDADGSERAITRFYMIEPRTGYAVSCDPESFRFGASRSLRELFEPQTSYAFGLLGDLARVFILLDDDNGDVMFTSMLATLISTVVSETKNADECDDEGFRDFVQACEVADSNMLNYIGLVSDNLIETFQKSQDARQSLKVMVESVKHPKVRSELLAELEPIIKKR